MTLEKAMKILSVNSTDSLETVKKKYRVMVKKYHPDIYKGTNAKEIMQEINLAYEYITSHFGELRSFTWFRTNTQTHYTRTDSQTRYNYRKDTGFFYNLSYEQLYEQYAKIYGIHTEYRKIREMYLNLSKDSFPYFIMVDLKMILQNAMGIDIYELYSSIKKDGEKFNSTEKFNYILTLYALKIKYLSQKLNVSASTLYTLYTVDTKKSYEIKFMEWLNKKIEIVDACQFFVNGMLYLKYDKEMKKHNSGKPFFEWLNDVYAENLKLLEAASVALNMSKEEILLVWKEERRFIYGENFRSWLLGKKPKSLYDNIDRYKMYDDKINYNIYNNIKYNNNIKYKKRK